MSTLKSRFLVVACFVALAVIAAALCFWSMAGKEAPHIDATLEQLARQRFKGFHAVNVANVKGEDSRCIKLALEALAKLQLFSKPTLENTEWGIKHDNHTQTCEVLFKYVYGTDDDVHVLYAVIAIRNDDTYEIMDMIMD